MCEILIDTVTHRNTKGIKSCFCPVVRLLQQTSPNWGSLQPCGNFSSLEAEKGCKSFRASWILCRVNRPQPRLWAHIICAHIIYYYFLLLLTIIIIFRELSLFSTHNGCLLHVLTRDSQECNGIRSKDLIFHVGYWHVKIHPSLSSCAQWEICRESGDSL